jgi:hypothetical protein
MQIDSKSKILYVHIPRTGGQWFTWAWNSHIKEGDIFFQGKNLFNNKKKTNIECGRHGKLSGILEKLDKIEYNYSDHKIITMVREPMDRVGSSWIWFSKVKGTAEKHGWKTIDDMLDEFEAGKIRVNYMPQVYWLEEQGAKWDIIYKFEDLLQDPWYPQKDFPEFNSRASNNRLLRQGQNRTSYMTNKQKKRIKELYADDFKYLEKFYD